MTNHLMTNTMDIVATGDKQLIIISELMKTGSWNDRLEFRNSFGLADKLLYF